MFSVLKSAFYQMGRTSYAEGNGSEAPILPEVLELLDSDDEQTIRNVFAQGYFDAASEAIQSVNGRLE